MPRSRAMAALRWKTLLYWTATTLVLLPPWSRCHPGPAITLVPLSPWSCYHPGPACLVSATLSFPFLLSGGLLPLTFWPLSPRPHLTHSGPSCSSHSTPPGLSLPALLAAMETSSSSRASLIDWAPHPSACTAWGGKNARVGGIEGAGCTCALDKDSRWWGTGSWSQDAAQGESLQGCEPEHLAKGLCSTCQGVSLCFC